MYNAYIHKCLKIYIKIRLIFKFIFLNRNCSFRHCLQSEIEKQKTKKQKAKQNVTQREIKRAFDKMKQYTIEVVKQKQKISRVYS